MQQPEEFIGSYAAVYLIESYRSQGKHMSIRTAATICGVSHVAVRKKLRKHTQDNQKFDHRKQNILYIRNALYLANRAICPKCKEIGTFSLRIVNTRVTYRCLKCHREFLEKFITWPKPEFNYSDYLEESGNMLPKDEGEQ